MTLFFFKLFVLRGQKASLNPFWVRARVSVCTKMTLQTHCTYLRSTIWCTHPTHKVWEDLRLFWTVLFLQKLPKVHHLDLCTSYRALDLCTVGVFDFSLDITFKFRAIFIWFYFIFYPLFCKRSQDIRRVESSFNLTFCVFAFCVSRVVWDKVK